MSNANDPMCRYCGEYTAPPTVEVSKLETLAKDWMAAYPADDREFAIAVRKCAVALLDLVEKECMR